MTKLAPILTAITAVILTLQLPLLTTAGTVKYGWCYPTTDCSGSDSIQVNGPDTQKQVNLMTTTYPYCASYLAAPDPPTTTHACQQGCTGQCQVGFGGKCTYLAPGSPKGSRFQCVTRG